MNKPEEILERLTEQMQNIIKDTRKINRTNAEYNKRGPRRSKKNFIEGCSSLTEITIKNTKEKSELQQQTNLHVKFKIDKQQICCIV